MVKIKLGDVIDFKNGKSVKKSDGIIPIYGGNGILGYTDKSNFSHTIVVGRVGAYCGSIHVEENSCWVSDNAIAGVPREGQDLTYLYYVLKSLNLNSKQIGSSQPLITQSMLKDMVVDIEIDIEKQKKIANSISIIDQKIQINNQINQELEAMAKTLYDYWFVQFDFPDQNGNPYKSSGGKMVYHPELKREIPEGWGVEKLGDITICHDSKRVPLSSNEREHVKGEIPYYGATGIMDYVNDYIFDGDYVLMAEDGSVMTEKGSPILQRISGKNWVNNHAHVLEPIKNHSCKLLMMLLKDVSVMKIKTGSIQMKINQENMNKIVVPAIPLELLFEINQKLEVIDKQQLNLIEENKQLTQLRDWLLPMLMNGQVKVE